MNLMLFNRAVANAGPMSDTQRKAMWAKRRSPAAAAGPRVLGIVTKRQAPSMPAPAAPGAQPPRGWGESRPGEMYPAVEGPGNPSWERRHPERAPGGLPADRPRGYTPPIIPQPPAAAPGSPYPNIPVTRPGAQVPEPIIGWDPRGHPIYDPTIPHIPEDPRFRPIRPGDTPVARPAPAPQPPPEPPKRTPPVPVPLITLAERIAERESANDPIPRAMREYLALRERTRRAMR